MATPQEQLAALASVPEELPPIVIEGWDRLSPGQQKWMLRNDPGAAESMMAAADQSARLLPSLGDPSYETYANYGYTPPEDAASPDSTASPPAEVADPTSIFRQATDGGGGTEAAEEAAKARAQMGGWVTPGHAMKDIAAGHPIGVVGMAQSIFGQAKRGESYLDAEQRARADEAYAAMEANRIFGSKFDEPG